MDIRLLLTASAAALVLAACGQQAPQSTGKVPSAPASGGTTAPATPAPAPSAQPSDAQQAPAAAQPAAPAAAEPKKEEQK